MAAFPGQQTKEKVVPRDEELAPTPQTRGGTPPAQGGRTPRGRVPQGLRPGARERVQEAADSARGIGKVGAVLDAIAQEQQDVKAGVGPTTSTGRTRGSIRSGGTAGGGTGGGTPTFAVEGNFRSGVLDTGLFTDTTGLSAIDKLNPKR